MRHIFSIFQTSGNKSGCNGGQITEAVKAARSEKMLELNRQRSLEYEESMIGKNLEILLEEEVELQGKAYYLGHSREYVKVAVEKQKV